MPEFLKLISLTQAREILLPHCHQLIPVGELLDITRAGNRVLSQDILAPEDLPPYDRSTVDGYALQAQDTFGASLNQPALLKITGEVLMGEEPPGTISSGQAMRISTGGKLPLGANAVVMREYTELVSEKEVEILRAVAPGENVLFRGEDIPREEKIMTRGKRLEAADLGALAGLGILQVEVFRLPGVGIISTGEEIIPPCAQPLRGKIRDINSYSLYGAIQKAGGQPYILGIVPDQFDLLRKKLEEGIINYDLLIISGSSSKGTSDLLVEVIASLEEPGLLVHGLAIKPGKPTIIARINNKLIFGLPGHPFSALVVFYLLIDPLIRRLSGGKEKYRWKEAQITREVASAAGREDFLPVILEKGKDGLRAHPLSGKSGMISLLTRAQGLARIPPEAEGIVKDEVVEVLLLREEIE